MAAKTKKTSKKKIAVLAENLFEDLEAWYPILRLREAGCEVVVVGPEVCEYKGKHGVPLKADVSIKSVKASQFDGVIVPGGYAPDKMRTNAAMVKFVATIFKNGGLVASICHGPWVLAEADIVRGKNITCVPAVKTDLINAGAIYHDKEVVIDGNLVTSRRPPDLPAMMKGVLKVLDIKA